VKKVVISAVLLLAALSMCFAQELVRKSDTLSANDEKYLNKTPIKWYSVTVKAGNRLAIRAASVDFTPLIVVNTGYGADLTSGGQGGSASFSYSSEADAAVKVGITSMAGLSTGSYMVRIFQAPAQVAIKVGDRITAELAYDDETMGDGQSVKWYSIAVKKGQRLAAAVWSDTIDPGIVVSIPGGAEILSEESSSRHAAARFICPKDGEVRIGVTTEDGGIAGTFTLQVLVPKDAKAIAVGESVNGSLKDGDDMLAGKPMDAYRLHGKASSRVVLHLSSSMVDTVIYAQDATGRVDSNDDIMDDNTDSELSYTFTAEGDLEIRVYALDETERGDYRLWVTEAAAPQSLRDGDSIQGTLTGGDDRVEGKYVDRFMYAGTTGQVVTIDLASDDFDAFLQITGLNGETDENDDVGEDITDSQISYTFPRDGTIQILATTLDPGESGAYVLKVSSQRKR
jgi:hypothetical protein